MKVKTKVSKQELKEYAEKHSWQRQMKASRGLDSFDNYSGPSLGDLIVVVGRNRDSEILEESNFDCALEMLGSESEKVKVERFGHWGCGWFELILVDPKSTKHVEIAYNITKALKEYPVLDESDYSDREHEYHSEYANDSKNDLAEAIEKHFGVKNTKKLVEIAHDLQIECQRYYGNDSCINIYDCRKPDSDDIERLKTCIDQLYYPKTNKKLDELKTALERKVA